MTTEMHRNSSRFLSHWLAAFSAFTLMILGGCQAPIVTPQPQLFGSIRVMNFAQRPAGNFDVYWWKDGEFTENGDKGPLDPKYANIHNLSYGGGAVYTNGIEAAAGGTKYHYKLTVPNQPESFDLRGDITLFPGKSNTLLITNKTPGSLEFTSQVLDDGGPTSNDKTFVRLINMQPNSGKVVLRVNDPIWGTPVIGSNQQGIDFNQVSNYESLPTGQDVSFTFYLTPVSSNEILQRLTYQTFTAGNYFTIVYGGDTSRIPEELAKRTTDDSAKAKLDNIRLRVFPDDNVGADQTNPIDSAFRYIVINGLYPLPNGKYAGDQSQIGITVNGEAIPYLNGFTLWPVEALSPAGASAQLEPDGVVWDVQYKSTLIPNNPIGVSGATFVDGKKHPLFDLSAINKQGIDQTQMRADTSISIIITNSDSTLQRNPSTPNIVGLPASVPSDSIAFVFVGAIAYPVGGPTTKTTFHVDAGSTSFDAGPYVTGQSSGATQNTFYLSAADNNITISDVIGVKPPLPGTSVHFIAEPGGIYEIVSVGVRPDLGPNKILVIRTNKQH